MSDSTTLHSARTKNRDESPRPWRLNGKPHVFHDWVETDRTVLVSNHTDHPQDLPRPARYDVWRCAECGHEDSFYSPPLVLRKKAIVFAVMAVAGISIMFFAPANGWTFAAAFVLLFPVLGLPVMLLAVLMMTLCSGIGWCIRRCKRR